MDPQRCFDAFTNTTLKKKIVDGSCCSQRLILCSISVFTEALKDYEENVSACAGSCSYSVVQIVKAAADFFGIFGASFLVGSVMGCITALLTKFTQIR